MAEKFEPQKKFSFFIPGRPVPWARTRVGHAGSFFTPTKQRLYKLSCASIFSRRVRDPIEGPVAVVIRVQLMRPKSNKTLLPATRNTSDVDNWAKMILDAGNGIVWKDDAQVIALEVSKVWVIDEKAEGVLVEAVAVRDEDLIETVEEIPEDELQ